MHTPTTPEAGPRSESEVSADYLEAEIGAVEPRIIPSRPIPPDLYGPISRYVHSSADLARCLRVSKSFHYHAVRQLYTSLVISFDYAEAGGKAYGRPQAGELCPSFLRKPKRSVTTSAEPNGPPILPPATANHPSLYQPNRTIFDNISTYTTHLTVMAHSHAMCQKLVRLNIPGLISLRFRPSRNKKAAYALIDQAGLAADSGLCPMLINLHPRRVAIGGSRYEQAGLSSEVLRIVPKRDRPPVLRTGLAEIMVFMHDSGGYGHKGPLEECLTELPATVERLVVVVASCAESWERWGRGWGLEADPPETLQEGYNALAVRRAVTGVCCGRSKVIEVIGLETLSDVINERSIERGQREFREGLRKRLLEKGWEAKEADERVEGVIFTSAS